MNTRDGLSALRRHWPEYLIEGWALGMFMISAGAVTTLFDYPGSPLNQALQDGDLRRVLTGISVMSLTGTRCSTSSRNSLVQHSAC
jgi:aquaporin Z